MADKTFGSASLILATDSKPLEQGLQNAQSQITGFITQINSQVAVVATGGWGALIAGVATAWSSVSGFWDRFKDKAFEIYDDIKAQGRQAMQLGLSTTSFQELLAGARTDADTLVTSLSHMQRSISELGQGSIQAQTTFGRLGLTMNDLGGSSADQFRKIVATIADLKNPADQAGAAFRVFGKSAGELLPAIRGGMDEAIEKAKKLGLVLSDEDNLGMAKVSRTWGEVSKIGKGIWQQFAAAVVPIFQSAADLVKEAWEGLAPVFRKGAELARYFAKVASAVFLELKAVAQPVLEQLVTLFRFDLDAAIQALIPTLEGWARDAAQAAGFVLRAFRDFAVWMHENIDPLALDIAEKFVEGFRFLNPLLAQIQNGVSALAEVFVTQFEATFIQAIADIGESAAKLVERIPKIGPTLAAGIRQGADAAAGLAGELKGFKLPRVDAEQMDKGFAVMLEKIQAMKDALPDLIANMKNLDLSPEGIEAFLTKVFDRVHQQAEKAKEDLVNEFTDAIQINDKQAGAFQFGSKEAANVIYQAQFGGNSGQDKQLGLMQEGNKHAAKTAGGIDQIVNLLKNGAEIGVI